LSISAPSASEIRSPYFDGVAVDPRDRAQPTGDRRSRSAVGFHVAAEALDVGPACGEQVQPMLLAPGRVLAQI
jgi:hypothetical protein